MIKNSPLSKNPQKSIFLRNFILNNKIDMYANHSSDDFVIEEYRKRLWEQKNQMSKYLIFSLYTGMCTPFIYFDNGVLNCAGVINYDSNNKIGTFELNIVDNKIIIENVHSYFVYTKLYDNDKYYILDYKHVADINDLNDIYIAASVKDGDSFNFHIYHNSELVFFDNNIYPELSVDFNDSRGQYKDRVSYVRYSKSSSKKNTYKNFLYSIDDLKLYQLDNSKNVPSSFLNLYKQSNWNRLDSDILGDDSISIYLYLNNSKTSQILSEFIKNADKIEQINNIFVDDDTVNLKVTYINRPFDVKFVYYCYLKDETVLGTAVMGIPINELYKGTKNNPFEYIYVTSKNNAVNIDYCKKIVRELFERCGEKQVPYQLPKQIYNYYIDSHDMHVYIYQYLRDLPEHNIDVPYFSTGLKMYETGNDYLIDLSKEKNLYESIFEKLIAENNLSTKWKSELTLYQQIKKHFPDAIYQYHCEWLGLQSLDIYVPSIRTGFEYQGKQHYEAVEHFGGVEAFEKRKLLDLKKKELCVSNDVKLIEWKYDEPINQTLLKEKLHSI